MKLSEFNLLELDVFDGDNLIYSGLSEDLPKDLQDKHIDIIGIDGKKVITKLTD